MSDWIEDDVVAHEAAQTPKHYDHIDYYNDAFKAGRQAGHEDVVEASNEATRIERERCAKIAENFSNAKPGDICEVMAGDFQKMIADAIRKSE